MKAVITGTFDPVTRGHIDIVKRASKIFDEIYICVVDNPEKKTMFTGSERVKIISASIEHSKIEGIAAIEAYDGLTSDYMREREIFHIVRGIRNATDFDYEYGMAEIMKRFLPGSETVFLPSAPENVHISSTFVREIIKYGGPLEDAVPNGTADLIRSIYESKITCR